MTDVDVREAIDHAENHYAHADDYSAACICGWTHRSPVYQQSWRASKLHLWPDAATRRAVLGAERQSGTRTPPGRSGAFEGGE